MRYILALTLALTLGACTATGNLREALSGDGDKLENLAKFTVADLEAAQKSAIAHNDPGGAQCWAALLETVRDLQAQGRTEVVGFATRWQQARNIRRGVQAGVPELVHINCAHMLSDVRSTLLGLGRLVL